MRQAVDLPQSLRQVAEVLVPPAAALTDDSVQRLEGEAA